MHGENYCKQGPQCRDHLCDVVLPPRVGQDGRAEEGPAPIRFGLHEVDGGARAIQKAGVGAPWTGSQLADAFEHLALTHDQIRDRLSTDQISALTRANAQWRDPDHTKGGERVQKMAALRYILSNGFTLTTAAHFLDLKVEELVRWLQDKRATDQGHEAVLKAESLLRSRMRPYSAIAAECGLADTTVAALSETLGLTQKRGRAWARNDPRVVARVKELAADGVAVSAIHRQVKEEFPDLTEYLTRHAVDKICHRSKRAREGRAHVTVAHRSQASA